VIRFDRVRKAWPAPDGGQVVALDGVDLHVEVGQIVALIGPSGCGKTTTLKCINRLVEPDSGRVEVGGVDISTMEATALRRRIGWVIQKGGLFPHMTVAQNIGLLPKLVGGTDPARVDELLELVRLSPRHFRDRYPSELSGGQAQRVGVARALVQDPEILLMDEPFGALDPVTRRQLHVEFKGLLERVAKTVVLVTHDMAEAFAMADRVVFLEAGRVVQDGTPEELRAAPATAEVASFLEAL